MARVNFTPDDVARTRFAAAPAPLVETVLAMVALRRAAFARSARVGAGTWVREARREFPATARPLLDLLGPFGPWPDFFDQLAPDLEEGLTQVRATSRADFRADLSYAWGDRQGRPPAWVRNLADGDREAVELVVRALRDLHDAVVAPRWEGVRALFHADVARRISMLAGEGHEALFGTLHPRLRWRDGGLERAGGDMALDLRGEGLVLLPSAFWTGEPLVCVFDGQRTSSVQYAAAPAGGRTPARNGGLADPAGGGDGLAALIGPTRACVLRALREPRGTVELAGMVRISPASASEHAKVLREAYLIETRRAGRMVQHSLTELGRTILGQLPVT